VLSVCHAVWWGLGGAHGSRAYTASRHAHTRYYHGSYSHFRGNTAVIVPIIAVITAVTAVLLPFSSPCHSLVL